jgi:hypothetical protein
MLKAIRQHVVPHLNHSNNRENNDLDSSLPSSLATGNNNMGNVNVQPSAGSCSSGLGSNRGDILRTVTSQEELQEYVKTQSRLELAATPEEASEAMSSMNGEMQSNTSNGSQSKERRVSLKGVRHKGHKMFDKVTHAVQAAGSAVGHKLHAVEEFMFPHTPQFGSSPHPPNLTIAIKVRGGVLLRGCHADDEHRQRTREVVELLRPLKGEEGLKAVGLEFRIVPITDNDGEAEVPDVTEETKQEEGEADVPDLAEEAKEEVGERDEKETSETPAKNLAALQNNTDQTKMMTRLFHAESNTMITMKNRKQFIADGDMYDAVARVCQQYAQEVMIREGNLEWVTVSEAGNNPEPIRALVSSSLSEDESNLDKVPTLLIATGKGKVRAGVFSRQHLIVTGIECSTALSIVREAQKRKMHIVMLDPNVHGDRLGMITFEKSMARIFRRWEQDETCSPHQPPLAKRDLFVLSHSQSGAQFARYLLDKSEHYVPHIRAIAFTDSTHNIQWAKERKDLHQLLESDSCVYFKCSKESEFNDDTLDPLDSAGKEVDTDTFWQHRFGRISTRCAGTTEHSLTNWFARQHIWEHFDQFLHHLQGSG